MKSAGISDAMWADATRLMLLALTNRFPCSMLTADSTKSRAYNAYNTIREGIRQWQTKGFHGNSDDAG